MSSPGVQVSAQRWALLHPRQGRDDPRDLAWELSRSVFGTTAEVSRLLALRLLSVAGHPAPGGSRSRDGVALLSFIRAVSGEKAVGRATGGVGAGPAPRGDGW